MCRVFNQFCENKLDNCRKFWNLKIIHHSSLLFIRVLRLTAPSCAPSPRGFRTSPTASSSRPPTTRTAAAYVYSNSKLERIFLNFQHFFPNFSKTVIFEKFNNFRCEIGISQKKIGIWKFGKNLGDFDSFRKNYWNSGILSSKSVNFGQLLQLENTSDILKMKLHKC